MSQGIDLFWDWMEGLNSGIDRKNPDTWANSTWPGNPDLGFFTSYGGAHSRASWFMRTRPRIKEAFAKIWNTTDLITSFDTFIAWRPWWLNKSWTPYVENLHIDQNPHNKKGFHCVQGMVPLYDVDEVGGLMVVPDTNNDDTQKELSDTYHPLYGGDFLELPSSDPNIGKGVLIKCNAGDLILWDSRTIHGGLIINPTEEFKAQHKDHLVRLSLTVSMMPKSSATEEVLKKRRMAFEKRIGLTHWANEFVKGGMGVMAPKIDYEKISFQEVELTQ